MSDMHLKRIGLLMEPETGNPFEVEGVLNPAAIRGPDGGLYLFPRLVAKGNYSRIGIAKVRFNEAGDPCGVERLGIALEPEADYELRSDGGGCEDPRVTFVETLQCYVMTYTAFSSAGPRIAVAASTDLFHWERLGLTLFATHKGLDFANVNNKDASLFPITIPNPSGSNALALLHRPLFPGTRPEDTCKQECRCIDPDRESIWISYCQNVSPGAIPHELGVFDSHHRLAAPLADWEWLKIGGGTPPVMTRHGWMIVYHGVHDSAPPGTEPHHLRYSAGLMFISAEDPRVILYRSPTPVLSPDSPEEQVGLVANVVFPTGIDRRDDLGQPYRFDVYYGMADSRIGVARLDLPKELPTTGHLPASGDAAPLVAAKCSCDERN